jgi:hypothetical protein
LDYLKEKKVFNLNHRKYEKSKYSSAAGLPTFKLQKNKNRLQNDFTKALAKGKDRLRGDGLKVSNVYLDIGYYSLSTSSVTFKNKFGIGQKGYG